MTAERRQALAERLSAAGQDAALITDLINVRYLTGFTGSNGAAFIRADGTGILATDSRYRDQVDSLEESLEGLVAAELLEPLIGDFRGVLALETHRLSVDDYERIAGFDASPALVSLNAAVEELRQVKDEAEVTALDTACQISIQALTDLLNGPLVGRTERAVARDLENRMLDLGAEAIAFDTICAAGPNSAIPHHQPTEREIQPGDFLKLDFGARVDGYHADCTRTVVVGSAAGWQREIYEAVRTAQQAGIDALAFDQPLADARRVVDASLEDAGYLEYFTTGLGHGVGLEIHEDPFLRTTLPGKVVPRITLTVEPGIYLPGRGGVRIEDTVVTTAGAASVLTDLTKDLLEL